MKTLKFFLILMAGIIIAGCSDDEKAPVASSSEDIVFTAVADGTEVTLTWTTQSAVDIWRKIASGGYAKIAENVKVSPYVDELGNEATDNTLVTYRLAETGKEIYVPEVSKNEQTVRIVTLDDEGLLDLVQSRTLKYFYDFAHPQSGMARERNASGDVVTTGGTGFGVMALIAGAERGFITRAQAYEKIRQIVGFLKRADRFHGAYAHWYNGSTGRVQPFSEKDNGGDLVETSFLFEGLLTAKEYFGATGASAEETTLANDIEALWRDIEWSHYERNGQLMWHWSPDYDFAMNMGISGWNEALMAYILAASSPTYPISKNTYEQGWARNGGIRYGGSFYDITLPLGNGDSMGGPLFFAHYSFMGLDPRGLKDRYCDNYFEQNKAHVLINRAYCVANPKKQVGYSADLWGLTASDCPVAGYLAHSPGGNDNGTIAPTAALASMPYAPDECLHVMRYLYREMGDTMFGEYGFYDALNLGVEKDKQVVKTYLAIDQGPIVVMIENYRSQFVWNTFMKNADVQNGLKRLGFTSPQIP